MLCKDKPVSHIAEEVGISRQYSYKLRDKAVSELDHFGHFDSEFENNAYRTIISIAMHCQASLEAIQRCLQDIYGLNMSIGKIENVLQCAAAKAEEINQSISLENICQGANDEIFQGSSPIMAGIDLQSTYTYLLSPSPDRTGETWQIQMEYCKDRGLDLAVSVSDAGSGLLEGIADAFPNASIQIDLFHVLRDLGREVNKLDNSACRELERIEELRARLAGSKPRRKTRQEYDERLLKINDLLEQADTVSILFGWIRELLGFTGYSTEEVTELCEWILSEMASVVPERKKFLKEIDKFRKRLPQTISFLRQMYRNMEDYACQTGLPVEAIRLAYRQRAFSVGSQEHTAIGKRLWHMLGDKIPLLEKALSGIISSTMRASSLVENLNSRIRPYINAKKRIGTWFFPLLQLYINTKKYRRSRKKERIGKSPLELLTGHPHPDFLDMLEL